MSWTLAGRVAARIAMVAGAILIVLVVLEGGLRWRPTLLGQGFANGVLSKYHHGVGGIFVHDRRLGLDFMVPNYRTTMYYNGYVWLHETDALGFRNKPLHVPADVMLLGDSVVYGHGVDFEHTLGRYLEQRSGLRVANLARQGDCAFQEAYLLTEYLPVFKPRFVVHVFSPNDIEDLYAHLHDETMEAFLAQPVDRITFPSRTDPATLLAARERWARTRGVVKWADEELYVMKMYRWIEYSSRPWRPVAAVAGAEVGPVMPNSRRVDPARVRIDPESLGWRYTAHALAHMKHLTDRAGAGILMAPMLPEGRQLEILRSIAVRHAIEIVDTSPLYAGASFLPRDGHFTPDGARTMADLIAAHLAGRSAVRP